MTECNGWTNYETWNCNLWIDEEEMDSYFAEIADETLEGTYSERVESLATAIKDWVEENNPLNDSPSLYSDILGGGLRAINYREIAEHIVEDLSLGE